MNPCECGCGREVKNRFAKGHHMRLAEFQTHLPAVWASVPRGPDHWSWKGGVTRRGRTLRKGPSCERCSFVPEHSCQLALHMHRSEDSETLCHNCHTLVTRYEKQNGLKEVSWRTIKDLRLSA